MYLASPYSDPDPKIQELRFKQVCIVAGKMLAQGRMIFSPIAHTHSIAQATDLPTDWEFWSRYDKTMLRQAAEFGILCLTGYTKSKGVIAEIKISEYLELPTFYFDPKDWL